METLLVLWLAGAITPALAGAIIWIFALADPETFSAKLGARCILLCWAWPLLLLLTIPVVIRDAIGREGRNR